MLALFHEITSWDDIQVKTMFIRLRLLSVRIHALLYMVKACASILACKMKYYHIRAQTTEGLAQ